MRQGVQRLKEDWAEFVGPEATPANSSIALGSGALGALGAALWSKHRGAGVTSTAVTALSAFDLVGGAYVNNTRASVRWYERAGQGGGKHLRFAALHVHPVVFGLMDQAIGRRTHALAWALAHYGYMMASTVVVRAIPAHRRSVGVALTAGGLLLDHVLRGSAIAPWFAWTYYPKLLLGHAAASLWTDDDLGVAALKVSTVPDHRAARRSRASSR